MGFLIVVSFFNHHTSDDFISRHSPQWGNLWSILSGSRVLRGLPGWHRKTFLYNLVQLPGFKDGEISPKTSRLLACLHHPLTSSWHEAMSFSFPKHLSLLIKAFTIKRSPLTHFVHSSARLQLFETSFLAERDVLWPRIISFTKGKAMSLDFYRAHQGGRFLIKNCTLITCQTAPQTETSHHSSSAGSN